MKKVFSLFLTVFFIFIAVNLFADTIILKGGQRIEGLITETTRDYIGVNVDGNDSIYYLIDIDEINGQKVDESYYDTHAVPAPGAEINEPYPMEEIAPTQIQPNDAIPSPEAAQPPLEPDAPPMPEPETTEPVKEPVY